LKSILDFTEIYSEILKILERSVYPLLHLNTKILEILSIYFYEIEKRFIEIIISMFSKKDFKEIYRKKGLI